MGQIVKRSEVAVENTWELERIYVSDEAWESDFERLKNLIPQICSFKGKLTECVENFAQAMKAYEEINILTEQLWAYASMRYHQDTANSHYQELQGKIQNLYTQVGEALAFIEPEVMEADESFLEALLKEETYSYYHRFIKQLLRRREHVLSAEMEELLAQTGKMAQAPSDIYEAMIYADMRFEDVIDEDGNQQPLTAGRYFSYQQSTNRNIRKQAYEKYYKQYMQYRDVFAASFSGNVTQAMFYAKASHYKSTRNMYLSGNFIPEEVYDNLIEAVHANMEPMYRYIALRKKLLKLDEVHMYDIFVPLAAETNVKYTFTEAKELVKKALAPMGEEYLSILQEGFDNRWIDVYENEGKYTGAYSYGIYTSTPFVLLNYTGDWDSVSTLAHEMGHAIHSYYSTKNQKYLYAGYKIFVAEVASTCNEVLLIRYMLENCQDKTQKASLLNHFLENIRSTVYRQTMFAEFERDMHRLAEEGNSLTADSICKHYKELLELYFGPDMAVDEELTHEWTRIPHFYTPFYVYQYATGFSAAMALASRILKEGEPAVEDYKKFLKGGSSLDPIDLLKLAGVDMSTPQPINDTLSVFADMVAQLEELCE